MKNFIIGFLILAVLGLSVYIYTKDDIDLCFADNSGGFAPLRYYHPTIPVQGKTKLCLFNG